MRKQTYIRPTFTIVHFQPPLLETISGRDQEGVEIEESKQSMFELYDELEEMIDEEYLDL